MFERYSILTTDDMREAQKKTEKYRKSQREKSWRWQSEPFN